MIRDRLRPVQPYQNNFDQLYSIVVYLRVKVRHCLLTCNRRPKSGIWHGSSFANHEKNEHFAGRVLKTSFWSSLFLSHSLPTASALQWGAEPPPQRELVVLHVSTIHPIIYDQTAVSYLAANQVSPTFPYRLIVIASAPKLHSLIVELH
jgi:hypothetical protein